MRTHEVAPRDANGVNTLRIESGDRVRMRRYALTLVSAEDAEDVVQEALARGWARRETFNPTRGTELAWLLAIVKDRSRRARRLPVAPLPEDWRDGQSRQTSGEESVDLRAAITRLPASQREVVVLHYYVDLTVRDIARLTGRAEGTVKSQLHDAEGQPRHHPGSRLCPMIRPLTSKACFVPTPPAGRRKRTEVTVRETPPCSPPSRGDGAGSRPGQSWRWQRP